MVMADGPRHAAAPESQYRVWRDARVLRIAAQLLAFGVLVWVVRYLWGNFVDNTDSAGISRSFDYLDAPAGFQIQNGGLQASETVRDAFIVGIKNTFASVIVGVPIALILGTLIGVGRLSTNWLVNKFAAAYVELFRNTPPIVVIFVVNVAVVLPLPIIQEAFVAPADLAVISNIRLAAPSFVAGDNGGLFTWLLVGSIIVGLGVALWRTRVHNETGAPHHRVLWFLGTAIGLSIISFFALGQPVTLSKPMVDGFAINGGIQTLGPFVALTLALALYTASHIAEIVRGSILAVPKGQTEAASAVALSSFQRYRHVVLPQAFRIAVPPIINQFLNYTKNTSLALSVGYAEVTFVAQTVTGNGNPASQSILILMASYLTFSLTISALLNVVNRRLQLVGR